MVILATTAPHPGGNIETVKIRTTDGIERWVDAAECTIDLSQYQ